MTFWTGFILAVGIWLGGEAIADGLRAIADAIKAAAREKRT